MKRVDTTFRPRRARVVSILSAVAVVVFFTVLAITMDRGGATGWTDWDSRFMIMFGVIVALCVLRFGLVRAVPAEDGLHVHNLVRSRTVPWEEIVSVQFGRGASWLMLDLADTEQLAVMAIQGADGSFAQREAQRLANLVQRHTRSSRDD